MDKKTIDNIVWWIPFKTLRNSIRNYIVEKLKFNRLLLEKIDSSNKILQNINQNLFFLNRNINMIISNDKLGNLLNDKKYEDPKRLEKFGYKVYSQNDEDGIIHEIFNRIGIKNNFFVEFGVQDGLQSNSHYLLFQGWKGVFIEGSEEYYKKNIKQFQKSNI